MKLVFGLALLAALGSQRVVAAEVVWMDLYASVAYQDATTACQREGSFLNRVYLAAEVSEGRFQRAVLKRGSTVLPFREIAFSPEELSRVRLAKDRHGRYWLRDFTLSARLAGWIFYQIGNYECGVPQPLATIVQAPLPFAFTTEGIGIEILVNESQTIAFTGVRQDGRPYKASMKLFQQWFEGP